jgi:hypothetical protein
MNHAKVSGPNNGFGDVTMIFNRTAVKDMVAVSPVDTGYYTANTAPWEFSVLFRFFGQLNH